METFEMFFGILLFLTASVFAGSVVGGFFFVILWLLKKFDISDFDDVVYNVAMIFAVVTIMVLIGLMSATTGTKNSELSLGENLALFMVLLAGLAGPCVCHLIMKLHKKDYHTRLEKFFSSFLSIAD